MTNLLHLIERDTRLKKVAGTQGGEWHGPCPFCGGRDRFLVQPNHGKGRWSCRQCSPRWQDAIAYVMQRDNLPFVEARDQLEGRPGRPLLLRRAPTPEPVAPAYPALSDPRWQTAAEDFVGRCFDRLDRPEGERARAYLLKRGLPMALCMAHEIGYNDRDQRERWGDVDVFLPRGIVIPWRLYGQLWRVNIRRPVGEPKYLQAAGGANGLYDGDLITQAATVVLVEGEFDAMSIFAGANRLCIDRTIMPLATGSVAGARLTSWVMRLAIARQVVLAFDDDAAGESAAHWWQNALDDTAVRLRPTRHDANAMLAAGDDLAAWLMAGVEWQSG